MFSLFTDCNDTPNFGLYLVFLISLRCAGVVELSAFTCMSLTKILVVLRPDVYIALNSVLTVNFATIFIILVTFIDCSLRLKLYLIDNCEFDGLLYEIFRKDLCGPFDAHNHTNTITNISIIDKEPSCPSYPVISVMIIIILVLESVKFIVAFIKIIIIISKKLKIINSNCTNDNDIKEDVNKIDDLKTVKAQSDLEANTDKREENPEEMKPNPEPTKIQVISCATSNDEIDEKPSETVTDIATNKEIVQDSIRLNGYTATRVILTNGFRIIATSLVEFIKTLIIKKFSFIILVLVLVLVIALGPNEKTLQFLRIFIRLEAFFFPGTVL